MTTDALGRRADASFAISFSHRVHVRWRRTVAAGKVSCIIRGKTRHGVSRGEQDQAGMINRQPSTRSDIYGHRARIGYTCPPLSAEVFPYEFYKLVPAGVTLVITMLTVIDRSQSAVA